MPKPVKYGTLNDSTFDARGGINFRAEIAPPACLPDLLSGVLPVLSLLTKPPGFQLRRRALS